MKQALIKQGDSRAASLGSSGLDLRDIGQQAHAIIEHARVEAQQIIIKARADAAAQGELLRQAAHRAGHEEGLKRGQQTGHDQGLAEAREKFAKDQSELIKSLTSTLAAFESRREQLYLAAKRDCIVLAIAIAGRILSSLQQSEELSQAALDGATESLALISNATNVNIRVHPDDKTALDALAKQAAGGSRSIQILADASVERGGARVESADCSIDSSVNGCLEKIATALVTDWRQRMNNLNLE